MLCIFTYICFWVQDLLPSDPLLWVRYWNAKWLEWLWLLKCILVRKLKLNWNSWRRVCDFTGKNTIFFHFASNSLWRGDETMLLRYVEFCSVTKCLKHSKCFPKLKKSVRNCITISIVEMFWVIANISLQQCVIEKLNAVIFLSFALAYHFTVINHTVITSFLFFAKGGKSIAHWRRNSGTCCSSTFKCMYSRLEKNLWLNQFPLLFYTLLCHVLMSFVYNTVFEKKYPYFTYSGLGHINKQYVLSVK